MNLRKIIFGELFLALAFMLGVSVAHAQEPSQEPNDAPPKPAAHATPIPIIDSSIQDDSGLTPLKPDTNPLTGVQDATLGTPETSHSYWMPGLQYASSIQSIGQGAGFGTWVVNNYFIGNLSLVKAWSRSELALNYSGGGFFSTDRSQGNGFYQQLAFSQSFTWNRLNLKLLDQFSFSPQSQFGFGGGTNLGVPGVGDPGGVVIPPVNNTYLPSQNIFASFGPRYSNASTVEATYLTSPRGSITASGTYGFLHFVNAGNIDNDSALGSVGYNYALTRESSIGADYRFTAFHYSGQRQALGSHVLALAYSRKVTGRLALQFNGGPQITMFRVPVGGKTEKLGANLSLGFSYAIPNTLFTGAYSHALSGGSGVFTGSTSDQVNASLRRRLTRVWSGNLNFGYAHNTAISNLAPVAMPAYDSVYVGGGVSRPIGRNFDFAAAYNVNVNRSSISQCTGPSCYPSETVHYITLNFQWHTRPFVLQ